MKQCAMPVGTRTSAELSLAKVETLTAATVMDLPHGQDFEGTAGCESTVWSIRLGLPQKAMPSENSREDRATGLTSGKQAKTPRSSLRVCHRSSTYCRQSSCKGLPRVCCGHADGGDLANSSPPCRHREDVAGQRHEQALGNTADGVVLDCAAAVRTGNNEIGPVLVNVIGERRLGLALHQRGLDS